jgi:hypothetical protein
LSQDAAWYWLKYNDPEFDKRGNLDHPYLSNRQLKKRKDKETPISSIIDPVYRARMDIDNEDAENAKEAID